MERDGTLRRVMRRADGAVYGAFLILIAGLMAFGLGRSVMEPQLGLRMASLVTGAPAQAHAMPGPVRVPLTLVATPGAGAPQDPASMLTGAPPALVQAAVKTLDLERGCLALAIYFEARGESRAGQRAVAEVILRRVAHRDYPTSICGVVLQGRHRATGCQFSFTCDGSWRRGKSAGIWREAVREADFMLSPAGRRQNLTGRATHFHAVSVTPYWADDLVRTVQIGNHVFYRLPSRSERVAMVDVNQGAAPVASRN